mmetsp:Transcript_72362/g.182539  ORF Transcript_72362/g.182539 Transcript_72362/m.182539 type:complete len:269 (+) Transcript_72362:496-1302(+)
MHSVLAVVEVYTPLALPMVSDNLPQSVRDENRIGVHLHCPLVSHEVAILPHLRPNFEEDRSVQSGAKLPPLAAYQVAGNNPCPETRPKCDGLVAVDRCLITREETPTPLVLHGEELLFAGKVGPHDCEAIQGAAGMLREGRERLSAVARRVIGCRAVASTGPAGPQRGGRRCLRQQLRMLLSCHLLLWRLALCVGVGSEHPNGQQEPLNKLPYMHHRLRKQRWRFQRKTMQGRMLQRWCPHRRNLGSSAAKGGHCDELPCKKSDQHDD